MAGFQRDEGASQDRKVAIEIFGAGGVFCEEGVAHPVVADLATSPVATYQLGAAHGFGHGGGLVALELGGLAFGFLGGDGHRHGRPAFVFAQGQGQQQVADVFAIQRQSARQGAVVGGEPSVEGVGKVVRGI